MFALLKLFITALVVVLVISAVFGIIAFFCDLRRFKGENNMSLPRAKLIEKILEQEELERQKKAEAEASAKKKEEKKEEKENEQ